MRLLTSFWKDEQGGGLIEYVLIIALIALAAIAAITAVGNNINTRMNTVATTLNQQ